MASSVTFDLFARDRASGAFTKVGAAAQQTSKHVSGLNRSFGAISAGSRGLRSSFGVIATGAKAAGLGLGAAAVSAGVFGLKTAASMETAKIGFTTMLGSGQKADKFLKQLRDFAAKTPFEFPELQTAASSLISVGINADEVIPIMRTLGDVTAGMGTGSEGVQRATVALQQMSAAGKITAEDLNQLRDAGVPVFDLLAAATGRSKAKIVELAQAGKLGKEDLDKLFDALGTGKGLERFNGLMEKQSKSLSGLFSTLKDNVSMTLANLVTPAIPAIKAGLDTASRLITDGAPKIQGAIGKAFTAIKIDLSPVAKAFIDSAKTWGAALITGVKTGLSTGDWSGLGQTVGTGILSAISGAATLAGKIAGKIGELLGKVDWVGLGIKVGKQAVPFVVGLVAGIVTFDPTELFKGMMRHWQDILLAAVAIWLAPARFIGKVGEVLAKIPLVGKLLEWGLNAMKGFVNRMFGAVGRFVAGFGKAMLEGFRTVFPGIGKSFAEWLSLLPIRIGLAALAVRAAIGRLIAGLGNAILAGRDFVGRTIGRLIGKLVEPFARAASWLVNAGGDLIRGLFSGIRSVMRGVGNVLSDVKDKIVGGLKSLFGIHSPSTVMAGIGGHIITGLIKGMLTNSGALARTVKGIGGTVANIFGGVADTAFGHGSTSSGAMQSMVAGYAQMLYGWTGAQWTALNKLLTRESNFNPTAQNPHSTAYGLFQFLDSTWSAVNAVKTSNPQMQTLAGLRYIAGRYGTPADAWNHEQIFGWYAGGMKPTVFSRPTLIGVGERGPETVSVTPMRHAARGGGTVNYIVNVTVPTGANLREVGREVVEAIKAYEKGSGTGWRQ